MQSSVPLPFPSTPLSTHKIHAEPGYSYPYKPTNSSPLAATSSSPGSSPVAAVQARRRSQYKVHAPSLPVASSSRSSSTKMRPVRSGGEGSDDSQTAFLRTRLQLRCIERASKARERAVKKKRFMSSSEAGSDNMDTNMEDDEEDDSMFDELFTRIMHNATRKTQHSYMYSYDREVGSSFDPDIEQNWESELAPQAAVPDEATAFAEELEDDAALQAYLEEQAAFADFADIPVDELFGWSDADKELLSGAVRVEHDDGGDMDMS
ncbi:hypothetical protein DFH09DRAFT_1185327 [Mycena vulgaris]|nr:hypothetical protein DFH09DRAFT_1185327 [Mycena vulgaris]